MTWKSSGSLGGADCPELANFDPSFAQLSVEALEQRASQEFLVTPSQRPAYLQTLKGALSSYREEKRECMYKVALVNSVSTNQSVRKSTSSFWGLGRSEGELYQLFLNMPLRNNWSASQRRDVLAQVEGVVASHGDAKDAADQQYWRRMYYGLLLLCEATDAAVAQFETSRPTGCFNFQPRH